MQKTAQIQEPLTLEAPARIDARGPVQFALLLTAGFFILGLIGINHHAIGHDEYRAWAVARASVDIPQLLHLMSFDGTPPLWHLCLWVSTAFTNQPFAMQLFHLAVASGAVFLMARFSPFTHVQKLLLTFGYFPFYEYGIISQGYSLYTLFLFAAAACFGRRRYTLLAGLLPLLASTTVFGAFAVALMTKSYTADWPGTAHHFGQLFMLLIASLWVGIDYQKTKSPRTILDSKPMDGAIVAVLFVHFLAGLYFYIQDLRAAVSPIKRTADFIKRHNLTETPMFVAPDLCATGITTLNESNIIYSIANYQPLRFERMDNQDKSYNWNLVVHRSVQASRKWQQPILLLSNRRIMGVMPAGIPFQEVAIFRSQIPDEARYLYVAGASDSWLQKHFNNGIRRAK
jgi:hypothetical protein